MEIELYLVGETADEAASNELWYEYYEDAKEHIKINYGVFSDHIGIYSVTAKIDYSTVKLVED